MFSIVIAVRDKAHTIGRTLDSVFAQTFADYELILVGAPEDASMAIAARRGDPRLRLIRQPNIGQGPARNFGVAASRHDWIAFLDADDLWLPGHLAELDEIRRRHPEAGLIGTRFVDTDPAGRYAVPREAPARIGEACYFAAFGRGENLLYTSSAAVPRWAFDQYGGFGPTRFGEDTELWARIALEHEVAASDRATVIYVHGTGGIIDTGRGRWRELPLASVGELSPPVAVAADAKPRIADRARRRAIDAYIRRYCGFCLAASALEEDVATIRRLRAVYWGRPRLGHAAIMAVSFLPDRPAKGALRLMRRLQSSARGLARRLRRGPRPVRESAFAAAPWEGKPA